MKTERLSKEELIKREKAVIEKICSNDDYAYVFFHEKCRPLLSNILWKIFGNNEDYDELVNELYLCLKKPNRQGEYWHNLKTFDYRTSLFDWIKTVAVRLFYTVSRESFTLPDAFVESGLAEEMFSKLQKAIYRKYLCFKYLDSLDDDTISDKLEINNSQLQSLSRKAIKQLKTIVSTHYPEYLSTLFSNNGIIEVDIDEYPDSAENADNNIKQEVHIDVYKYLEAMPNIYYRKVIKALFLDDITPEALAQEMNTTVSNIYNIKSRGLDQLRDVVLFSNEICNLENYINSVSDDRYRAILISIFIEKKDYDKVCSELKITEVLFKKLKKDAIKEIKNKIFKAKS